jgi:hypothetical protein
MAFETTCEAVESGRRRTQRRPSAALAAIDVEDMTGVNEAWSDEMKTIASASSSERPMRAIGTVVTRAALFSGVAVKRVNMPVSVGPGATAFTRTPDLATSSATDLVMRSTACLLPT